MEERRPGTYTVNLSLPYVHLQFSATHHTMHEVGLDQVSIGKFIPTVLRNLDAGLCRGIHHTKLGINILLFLSICEIVPGRK